MATARRNQAVREKSEPQQDRFDLIPKASRVGVHRVVAKPRRVWTYLLSGLVGLVVLVGAGMLVMHLTDLNLQNLGEASTTTAGESETSTQVTAQLDPAATVVVLNGTPTEGFASEIDTLITENQWGSIVFAGDAATSDVEISAVFYQSPEDEAAALGLAQELGGVSTFQSESYAEYEARLIVLIGSDYAGPSSELLSSGGASEQ